MAPSSGRVIYNFIYKGDKNASFSDVFMLRELVNSTNNFYRFVSELPTEEFDT